MLKRACAARTAKLQKFAKIMRLARIMDTEIYEKLKKITKSDHNIIECEFSISVPKGKKLERKEVFKMRNKEKIQLFRDKTEKAPELIEYFKTDESIKVQGKKWCKDIKNRIYGTFDKVRINGKKKKVKTEIDEKLEKRKEILMKIEGIELYHNCIISYLHSIALLA